jgi:VCBS repeat-containing protein
MAGPIFTGATSASFVEGDVFFPILDLDAAGDGTGSVEGNGITYLALDPALGDNKFFSIDELTGEIRFLVPPDFEMPLNAAANNTYQLSVTAIDAVTGLSTVQQVTIVVTDSGNDPIISTPNFATVNEGSTAVIDVNSSSSGTAEGDGIRYFILNTAGTDGALFAIDEGTGVLTFITAPNFEQPLDTNGDNVYNVLIGSAGGSQGVTYQNIAVTVANVNEPPVFTNLDGQYPGGPPIYTPGGPAVFLDTDATVADPDNAFANWNGSQLVVQRQGAAVTSDNYGFNFSGVPGFSVNGLSGRVTNGTMSASYTISGGVLTIRFGVSNSATPTDIGSVRPDTAFVNTVLEHITYLNPTLGAGSSATLNVTVFDGPPTVPTRLGSTGSVTVFVAGGTPNNQPVFDANVNPSGNEDTLITGSVHATDPDAADVLTYSVTSTGIGAPAHGTVSINSATGAYSYTPAVNYNGSDSFTVTVADGHGGSATQVVSVAIAAVNDAPVVAAALANQSSAEDTAFSFAVPAGAFTDVDNATLALSATLADGSALPAWVVFDAATGTFSGTPPLDFNGVLSVKVTATDAGGLSASSTFALNVTAVNDAPVVAAAIANQAGTEDTPVSFTVPAGTFTDVDNATLALTATLADGSALPAWLTFNAATGAFSGTPPLNFNGDIALKVTATDAGNLSASSSFTLNIAPVNDAPVVAIPLANQTSATNAAVSYTVPATAFTDVDSAALALTATLADGSALPTWLTFNAATGQFQGTPPLDFAGNIDIKVTATDEGNLSASSNFILTIAPLNAAPVFDAVVNPVGNEDTIISSAVHATDANVGDVLLYSIASGSGPAHGAVTLNAATGAYTYNPVLNYNGADAFTVTVSDGHGGTATQLVGVTINAVNDAPVAVSNTGAAGENQNIAFNVLANDTDVDNTNAQLILQSFTVASATGGIVLTAAQAQAAFSIVGNQLQFTPGTIFDGLSPGQNETVTGSYIVRDPGGLTSTATFTLTVAGALDTFTGTAANNTINGTAGADSISGLAGNDTLNGNAGNDTLNGGANNDVLNGGAGADILIGGTGIDTLNGGLGADTFRFFAGDSTSGNVRGSGDNIQDFTRAQGDKIDISTIDANTLLAGVQNFTLVEFHTLAQGVATVGNDAGKIVLQSANGVTTVFLHTNNDGVADFTFHLTGTFGTQTATNHLLLSDFIL